jgi:hypothetical protein
MYKLNEETGELGADEKEQVLRALYKDTIYYDYFKLSLRHAHENGMDFSVNEYDDHIKAGGNLFYDVVKLRGEQKKVQE